MIIRPRGSGETLRALGLVGGFGFLMGGSVLCCYFAGNYLDTLFGTTPWLLVAFLLMGVITCFMEFYQMLKKLVKRKDL